MKHVPYSYSKLSMHDQCNRKFKYRYIDKVKVPHVYNEALVKGGAVHSILEHYPEKSNHKQAPKYQHIADKFLKTEIAKDIYFGESIREMSFGLTKELKPCEYSDKNAMYRGYIDHIFTREDKLVIIDFKTGKYKEEQYQSYDQLMTYAIYFFQRYPSLEKIMISYVYVEHENLHNSLTLERQYLNTYLKQFLTLIKNAETDEEFKKNPTKLCDYCDFQEHCNKDS